ncbi:MAG: FRG domain-containing protein [Bacteroidales bacterium]|nr:FRG domain-containing protein [Bacteroidales bacterium]
MKLKEEYLPQSWTDLQEILFHDSYNKKIDRIRSPYVYRGLSYFNYEMKTSLIRLGGNFKTLEFHLLRNFKKYSHRPEILSNTEWDWLALAQHHGLPTRLLDWTYSPYVALHFATAELDTYDNDGIIWALKYEVLTDYLPEKLSKELCRVGSNSFTSSMLNNVYKSLEELSEESSEFTVAFESPSLDTRIVNQFAIFTFMSHAESLLDDWLLDKPDLYFRIRIPAAMKWEIRDKLDQVNINERVLFPGFDGLSKWLKRHYTPKN